MKFHYKAIRDNGEVKEGEKTAADKQALYGMLKAQGLTLVTAQAADEAGWGNLNISLFNRIKTEEKILFARNLSAMIDAGLAMARALNVMERQTDNDYFADIIATLQADIREGKTLSDGLRGFPNEFSDLFINMVEAGEESGDLSKALSVIAEQTERSYKLKRKIRGAMLYPAIILGAMIIVAILMLIYIVPTLTSTFNELNVELPASTRFIIAISDFLQNNTILALGGIAGVVGGFFAGIRTEPGKRALDWTLLKIPIIGELVKETNSSRTAHTMSSLLTSGVEITRAIEVTNGVVQNVYYKEVLEETLEAVKRGEQISEVFEKHEDLYPPFVSEMTAVGEETGKLAELLDRVGDYYEDDVRQKTQNMSTIVEPFLMIVIGIAVGFFALSMITPMYSLTNSL